MLHIAGSLVGLLITLAVCYWVYQDAQSRNNSSAIGWAIGTFFCCPIVPIIYLIMRGKSSPAV